MLLGEFDSVGSSLEVPSGCALWNSQTNEWLPVVVPQNVTIEQVLSDGLQFYIIAAVNGANNSESTVDILNGNTSFTDTVFSVINGSCTAAMIFNASQLYCASEDFAAPGWTTIQMLDLNLDTWSTVVHVNISIDVLFALEVDWPFLYLGGSFNYSVQGQNYQNIAKYNMMVIRALFDLTPFPDPKLELHHTRGSRISGLHSIRGRPNDGWQGVVHRRILFCRRCHARSGTQYRWVRPKWQIFGFSCFV
jgi:hypothetical protein